VETSDLYQLAADHRHQVHSFPLKESDACSVELNQRCYIALSDRLSGKKEKTQLAHELGHCEYAGFYNYHSPFEIRSRCETRADRWSILKLIPVDELRDAIRGGCSNVWELSEHFGVTEDFMTKAIKFYTERLELSLMEK